MENKTIKAISHCFTQNGIENEQVVGIYSPDKILEGLKVIKETMLINEHVLVKETKDCCNYYLEFKAKNGTTESFYTGDYILNEINL